MKSAIILFFIMMTVNAEAFTMNNSARLVFAQNEVKVNVAAGFCTNIGIDEQEILSIVGDAVSRFWNKAPTSRLKLRTGSLVTVVTTFNTGTMCNASTNCEANPALAVSSDILITCNTNAANFSGSSILAVTIPNNIAGNNIIGSLVMINDQASTQFDSKSREEKVSIIAHELGHAIGLGHSPVTDSLMYYATLENRTALGRDDMDGITYLYPKKQPTKDLIGGCGTISFDKKGPDWTSGLLLGFAIIFMLDLVRKNARAKFKTGT